MTNYRIFEPPWFHLKYTLAGHRMAFATFDTLKRGSASQANHV